MDKDDKEHSPNKVPPTEDGKTESIQATVEESQTMFPFMPKGEKPVTAEDHALWKLLGPIVFPSDSL